MKTSNCSTDEEMFEGGDVMALEKADSDIDNIDFNDFKGIYFDDDPNRKFQDPETGCHFEYYDLCKRMVKLKQLRKKLDAQLGLPPEPDDHAAEIQQRSKKQTQSFDATNKRRQPSLGHKKSNKESINIQKEKSTVDIQFDLSNNRDPRKQQNQIQTGNKMLNMNQ